VTAPRGAVAIIPVRRDSSRLPGKALLAETGRPLFVHTCEQALRAECFERVYVATDDDEVAAAAERAGLAVLRTSPAPRTGSERCAEAARGLRVRAVVDVQGDWPEVEPEDLRALTDVLLRRKAPCATLAAPLTDSRALADPNVVKVVRALDGKALYFSRAPIPWAKERGAGTALPLRHIGVYGFSLETLLAVPDLPSSGLAETESLEQLRFLENGIAIDVLDAHGDPRGIETRQDYDAFLSRWQAGRRNDPGALDRA
jgi:3-deoxy-manno-octulosonate cytidylyltransferase (CMP-KDO synthetase)